MSEVFSESYFFEEYHRFRKLMGSVDFWDGEKPLRAFEGITLVYLKTEFSESVETAMMALKGEFEMRSACLSIARGGARSE